MNKIKIYDLLSGKKVWNYYQFYKETQWYSKKQIEALQMLKLKKLLKHCYDNVPYYRKIINENHINISTFKTLNILNEFPLLTKEIIQSNHNLFIPINNRMLRGVKTSQTGGTTGNILFKRNDSNTRSSIWGLYRRYEDWMGIVNQDRTLRLMGGHIKKDTFKKKCIDFAVFFLKDTISINIYNTSDETIEKIIRLLNRYDITHIRSYPQFLFSVAQKMDQRGLSFALKSISTTAEPLMQEHRALFKKVFNADSFDQYGCGEIGGIAFECEKHQGLHISEEHVIVEQNENNELIITDLDNFTMPFIRYWNADQAIIDDNNCSCGRESKLITQIMGRTCDYVIGLNGQFLHWAYFWHLIFDSKIGNKRNLRKFQIIQDSKQKLLIKLVSNKLTNQEVDFIFSDIKSRLGKIHIDLSYETDIENTHTGKYRPVINKLI